jgi:hypothetical protein
MPIVEAIKTKTNLGDSVVVQSNNPFDEHGIGGSITLRLEKEEGKILVRSTADYRPEADPSGFRRGWQCGLTKDQVICLARELIKMSRDLP